jgi:UDP-N-acetyl-2-amino-2-deoxyglucuronate dehydrogenase
MTAATSEDKPLRFAVVGCGVIGKQHARVIDGRDDAIVTVAVDEIHQSAAELAGDYDAVAVAKLSDALARDDVDAVAICTPSGVHAEQAVAALDAGKHVVIEKPVDISLAAAAGLAAAEARSAGVVTVISQHRFDPASQAVHEAVTAGGLGMLTSGVATVAWWRAQSYYDSGVWRGTKEGDGGGALTNQGIHTIDLLIWMLGRPVEVVAYSACLAHTRIEVEDTAVAIVRFESGALGVVHGTTAAYPGLTARLQVHGTRGSAVIDDDRLSYFHAASDAPDEAPIYGVGAGSNQAARFLSDQHNNVTAGAEPAALSGAHSLQYADFINAVRTGRAPLVTVAAAAATLATVLAIYESAEHAKPVAVHHSDNLFPPSRPQRPSTS